MKKSPIITIVAIGIGAALFFVLGRFVVIPSPIPNVTIGIQYGLLGFMAILFGPIAGFLIGFIGHFLIDLTAGWGIWWSWVIVSGIVGLIIGLASKKTAIGREQFGKKSIIRFNLAQAIAHLAGWAVIAPTLDVLIYAEPTQKVFTQGLVSAASNIVTTAVIGTLLCLAYVKSRPQSGSLKEDE